MKKFYAALISLLFCSQIYAQFADLNNYVTRIWSVLDGLPGNSSTDILQTADGYMYFGTYEGLVSFDGYDFTILNKYTKEEFKFISARTVFEDSKGFLWIGSNDEGVQKINRTNTINESYTTENGLPNNSIRSFAEDYNHNVWIGTAAGIRYITPEGNVVNPVTAESGISENIMVKQLYRDTAGKIWVICNGIKAIYVYSGDTFSRYEVLDTFGDFIPSAVGQDKHGNFWFGLNQQGIVEVSNGYIKRVTTNTMLDTTATQTIFCDNTGSIWFGTDSGLVVFTDGEFIKYDEVNSISNSSIQKISGDREGNIWIATSTGGIGKVSPGKFRTNKLESAVNSICEDSEGKVWVGADNGLYCYNNDIQEENELTEFCKGLRIRHIEKTNSGEILVNAYTEPALIKYDGKSIKNWTKNNGLAGNKTRVSIETKDGNIYCGTTTGLSVIHKDGSIVNHGVNDGFKNEYIMCLYEDMDGNVWVGTDGGGIIILKDEKIVKTLSTVNGLSGNVIFKIKQDIEGAVWICTGSGISKINLTNDFYTENSTAEITIFTTANGLGSDSIFQLLNDDNGYVWMISNRGISSTEQSAFKAVEDKTKRIMDCKFYNQNDGLKSSSANSTALSIKDQYGRLWFTMTDGFAIYDAIRAKENHIRPKVQIKEVKIDDTVYFDFSKPIIIPAGTKHINIDFTGLSFTATERNRFIHKLEGFDDSYSEPSQSRNVAYTNLKPGKYKFYVNMMNGEGDFAETPAIINFVQKAYFYEMPIFWIILSLVVIILIFFTLISIILINKKKQQILEEKIEIATRDLRIAKDESESLLLNILPSTIAKELKAKTPSESTTIAERYENVTVLFSDIVGFTNTTSNHSAEEIVSSLNDLVSRFDTQAKKMGVEKIKTIGDAYMAVCGAPNENSKHAEIMLKFATIMFKELNEYNKTAKIKFRIRIGLNSGAVIAGVIGKNKFIYDIWGDTVNVASRMESNCNPMHVRMTESVVKNLEAHGYHYNYKVEEINVKGKGMMKTFELPNK